MVDEIDLEIVLGEILDELRDPQRRAQVFVNTYDIISSLTTNDMDVLQALADSCVPDATAAEIALALSGAGRWRMTESEIELLDAAMTAGGNSHND